MYVDKYLIRKQAINKESDITILYRDNKK